MEQGVLNLPGKVGSMDWPKAGCLSLTLMCQCFSQPGNPNSYPYCLETCVIGNINPLEYFTSDTYDIEQTICCSYVCVCLCMLHFFKTRSAVCSSTAASRDQVTSAVVNSGSTLRLCSLLRSVFRPGSPRFPPASPCPLLEDSQLCSLPGSSALWAGARRRRLLLRSRVSLSVICCTTTLPPRFGRLDSCQEAVTWRENVSLHNPTEHIYHICCSQINFDLFASCGKGCQVPLELFLMYPSEQKMNKPLSCRTVLFACFVSYTL